MNYAVLAIAGAAVIAGYGWQAERAAHANTRADWATERAAANAAALDLSTRVIEATSELQNAQEIHATEAARLRKLADRRAADAVAAGKRLQDAAADAAERARAQCADTAAAELRNPASDPIGVFAVVLGMADSAAGRMAEIATERGDKGLACQREHDTIREALKN